jgi:luciferase family oxidoreductase group 1
MKLSVLDLVPIRVGDSASDGFRQAVRLARHVESIGYQRYWIAEHHDAGGLGSSAPEILIGHIAGATSTLRVGSGGIMLPNHATLHIAEVFRTLEALHPKRIDLGLGRAPGSGSAAALALRRGGSIRADDFPEQVEILMEYLSDQKALKAIPTNVEMPEIWMLGSSDFGARLAAQLGLPFAFAQHFSSLDARAVLKLYRDTFQVTEWGSRPRAMMACHVICAETDEAAEELAWSSDASMASFIRTGKSAPLLTIEESKLQISASIRAELHTAFPKFIGSPDTIRLQLEPYISFIDELIVLTMIYDQDARLRSYELLTEAFT